MPSAETYWNLSQRVLTGILMAMRLSISMSRFRRHYTFSYLIGDFSAIWFLACVRVQSQVLICHMTAKEANN